MRIALIGDIHHYRLDMHWRHLLSKRALGHANLYFNRRHRFNHALLGPIIDRIRTISPDAIICTGDVTTTSLEDEFHDVAVFLKPLSDQFHTLLVPGNHDRYTFTSKRSRRIERLLEHLLPKEFPHFEKLRGRWHVLALDGARPQVFLARGALGPRQLDAVRDRLGSLTERDGLIVACHYPVAAPPEALPMTPDHQLADARALTRLLQACPARVVYVHGHIHRPWCWSPDNGRHRDITHINAGAPCMTSAVYPLGQGFWQIDLPTDPRADLSVIHHVPASEGRPNRRQRRALPMPTPDAWRARRVA